ncbi:hypothetical protein L596_016428 [Steinernema carpocapsae]|uniref:Uncharacterized protein n=1 Tax=Steinernema carpocapsae TaxID=34508 RepID=A0A4U5NI25_STECR|nr:hypothetical protein L596_016428 [Steinernema carpocapsae]
MSSLRLSLALVATVVASVLADFGPHEGYGSHEGGFGGRGFGGDHGAKFGFGHDVGHKESYGKGEKKDWAEFNHGGHQSHDCGEKYGMKDDDGSGSQHGEHGGYRHGFVGYGSYGAPKAEGYGYGYGFGAPQYGSPKYGEALKYGHGSI